MIYIRNFYFRNSYLNGKGMIMTWKQNKWVKYLEGYCQGKNQIQDEYVRKVAESLGLDEPLNIQFEWQKQITQQFEPEDAHGVIILTGTAGDGKTKSWLFGF